MSAHCRQLKRSENKIEIGEGPAADERKRTVRRVLEADQCAPQFIGDEHLARRRRQIEQRAIHIEQDGDLMQFYRYGQHVKRPTCLSTAALGAAENWVRRALCRTVEVCMRTIPI
jgi:hypothetical protein